MYTKTKNKKINLQKNIPKIYKNKDKIVIKFVRETYYINHR